MSAPTKSYEREIKVHLDFYQDPNIEVLKFHFDLMEEYYAYQTPAGTPLFPVPRGSPRSPRIRYIPRGEVSAGRLRHMYWKFVGQN